LLRNRNTKSTSMAKLPTKPTQCICNICIHSQVHKTVIITLSNNKKTDTNKSKKKKKMYLENISFWLALLITGTQCQGNPSQKQVTRKYCYSFIILCNSDSNNYYYYYVIYNCLLGNSESSNRDIRMTHNKTVNNIIIGRVDIFDTEHGVWRPVCGAHDYWNDEAAQVACSQLGFHRGNGEF